MLVKEFIRLHGNLPLSDITKAHFVALRDDQLAKVKPATVQARFNLLKAAFTVCLQDDKHGIKENPLQYVKIRNADSGEKERDAFTGDQLQTLFDSPVFTKRQRPIGGRGDAAFWCPLVALYTGARLDEILSLRTDGLYTVDGVSVFHFRHRPALGQKLKGKAKNVRRVPVHPELVRLGLMEYLKEVSKLPAPANGAGWLFPGIDRSEKVRNHSSAWGAWFGRYLTTCGIKTDRLTFHSFRHTFKHFSRACGIAEDQHDAMTGHTTAEVARRYGSCDGYPIEVLSTAMPRLIFGKLDLSKVVS
jgi:integrase